MEVHEALEMIIQEVENCSSCGRLNPDLRTAKLILHKYVINKLAEDKKNEEESSSNDKK